MPESTKFDPTDTGTLRPDAPPIQKTAPHFDPMKIKPRRPKINLPADVYYWDPYKLFRMYFTHAVVQSIVEHTNTYSPTSAELSHPYSRAQAWYPTCLAEIMIFYAIRIYMALHIENRIDDYWSTDPGMPFHPIKKWMSRNRFNMLRIRLRISPPGTIGPYNKVDPLSQHIQTINTRVWLAGSIIVVDESMSRFTGRANEVITITGKPTPTGFKVWVLSDLGFFLHWNWHEPGKTRGPVGVKTPTALGGRKNGSGGNKTQAVVYHLLNMLPKDGYHLFLDNLFTSNKFMEFLRLNGYAATGTCRTNSGILKDWAEKKEKDSKKDTIPWGTLWTTPNDTGKVCHIAWKDNALVLMMSTFYDGREFINKNRRRVKESSSAAKTARVPFGDEPRKVLPIPKIIDDYNIHMGAVDRGDQLASTNPGHRRIRRGGWQALENWLLLTIQSNCYKIHIESPKRYQHTKVLSQVEFKTAIYKGLCEEFGPLALGSFGRKRTSIQADPFYFRIPLERHTQIRRSGRSDCRFCKGFRPGQKRVILGSISNAEASARKPSKTDYGCMECDIPLCKKSRCFESYHGIKG